MVWFCFVNPILLYYFFSYSTFTFLKPCGILLLAQSHSLLVLPILVSKLLTRNDIRSPICLTPKFQYHPGEFLLTHSSGDTAALTSAWPRQRYSFWDPLLALTSHGITGQYSPTGAKRCLLQRAEMDWLSSQSSLSLVTPDLHGWAPSCIPGSCEKQCLAADSQSWVRICHSWSWFNFSLVLWGL